MLLMFNDHLHIKVSFVAFNVASCKLLFYCECLWGLCWCLCNIVGAILNTKPKISGTSLVVIWCLCSRIILLVVIHICVLFRILLLSHNWFQEFFVCWYFVTLMFVLFMTWRCSMLMFNDWRARFYLEWNDRKWKLSYVCGHCWKWG